MKRKRDHLQGACLLGTRVEEATGDPAFAIIDAAALHQAKIIVIGSRGMKAIKRSLLGSVSENVLVHARYSVLIVR